MVGVYCPYVDGAFDWVERQRLCTKLRMSKLYQKVIASIMRWLVTESAGWSLAAPTRLMRSRRCFEIGFATYIMQTRDFQSLNFCKKIDVASFGEQHVSFLLF